MADLPTAEFLAKYARGTPVPHAMGTDKALLSNRKAPQVPGVRQAHPWRAYVKRRLRHTGGRP